MYILLYKDKKTENISIGDEVIWKKLLFLKDCKPKNKTMKNLKLYLQYLECFMLESITY